MSQICYSYLLSVAKILWQHVVVVVVVVVYFILFFWETKVCCCVRRSRTTSHGKNVYVPDLVWDNATRLGDTPIGHWPKDSLSLYVYSKPSPVLSHFHTQYLPPSPIFLIFFSDHANVSLSPSDPFHVLPPNSLISQTHIPQFVLPLIQLQKSTFADQKNRCNCCLLEEFQDFS